MRHQRKRFDFYFAYFIITTRPQRSNRARVYDIW
jgi:hypothetical protein